MVLAGLAAGALGAAVLHKSLTKRIRTIKTIKNIEGDLYKVDYFADYKLEEVLNENIGSVSDLEKVLSKKLFFGYPIKTKENLFGCSAFSAKTTDGKFQS
ncbi:MAG: hypothetical protein EOM05_12705 [Clostridia bacterium]|nr:hypothetical protein [Clostridia bacterium]